MKSCDEYAALLDAYVDGECTAGESALLRAHLEECPHCRRELEEKLLLRDAFPDAEDTPVPDGFAERVMAALPPQSAPKAPRRNVIWWTRRLAPLAACLVVAAALWKLPGNLTARSSMADAQTETAASSAAASGDTSAASADTSAPEEEAAPAQDGETQALDSAGRGAQTFAARSVPESKTASRGTDSGTGAAQSVSPAAADSASGSAAEDKAVPRLTSGTGDGTDGDGADSSGENGIGENAAAENGVAGLTAAEVVAPEDGGREFTDRVLVSFETGETDAAVQTRARAFALYAESGQTFAWYGKWTEEDSAAGLYLCFGDGTAASLPLPQTAAGESAAPASLTFDGTRLVYTVIFSDAAAAEDGTVLHVRGTYSYTADIAAKTVSLTIG